MNQQDDRFLGKPTTADEFIRCLIWRGWDAGVAFDEGSRRCLKLKPQLIRESVDALSKRSDLSRYTLALSKLIRLSNDDDQLRIEWQTNLPQLRALLYTSPIGRAPQRAKLLQIAGNQQVVSAMRYALQQEGQVEPKKIEPTWIAVLYAEGSEGSVREADRFNALLEPKLQAALRSYRDAATQELGSELPVDPEHEA